MQWPTGCGCRNGHELSDLTVLFASGMFFMSNSSNPCCPDSSLLRVNVY